MKRGEEGMKKYNFTAPPDLVKKFDKFCKGRYTSRSNGIRDGMGLLMDGVRQPVAAEVPPQ